MEQAVGLRTIFLVGQFFLFLLFYLDFLARVFKR